ncbi:hypothetical protein [Bacillus phage YungSlug]|nr:hypothetical protein [Bacillus phage YungSlug]
MGLVLFYTYSEYASKEAYPCIKSRGVGREGREPKRKNKERKKKVKREVETLLKIGAFLFWQNV